MVSASPRISARTTTSEGWSSRRNRRSVSRTVVSGRGAAGITRRSLGCGGGRLELLLMGHLLGFGHQDLDDLVLRDPVLPDLAVHDQLPVALPGRDAEVGLPGLSGPVDDTAHHGHADRSLQL